VIVSGIKEVMENSIYLENMEKMSSLCKRYKSEEIIKDAVRESLEFGHEHLIEKRYD